MYVEALAKLLVVLHEPHLQGYRIPRANASKHLQNRIEPNSPLTQKTPSTQQMCKRRKAMSGYFEFECFWRPDDPVGRVGFRARLPLIQNTKMPLGNLEASAKGRIPVSLTE